jgi:large subunit ribosomal protein L25
MISVTCMTREVTSKGGVRRLRREGKIPVVIYSEGRPAELGFVVRSEVEAGMRTMCPGSLPVTVFELKDASGKARTALVREIQYTPTTYEITHIDFLELSPKRSVEVKVPVEFVNASECIGIKLGGQLRHIMRHVSIRCLPAHIPSQFNVDVRELGIRQSRRVKDLDIPDAVTCLANIEDVVVSIVKL